MAQRLADFLSANADALQLQSVIYNRRVWGYGRWSWRAYTGVDPHTTHVHIGMNLRGAASMTEAQIEAVFSAHWSGGGGNAQPPVAPPAVNPAPSQGQACHDADGATGVCKDAAQCTEGTPKHGLCPGAANIQCCLPRIQGAPIPQPQPAGACVRAKQGVNVRDRPSTSGTQVLLLAMAGEQFTQLDEQGGWLHVSNGRGSGWSFGTYWQGCAAGRAALEDDGQGGAELTDRAADGPGAAAITFDALPGWAYGIIGFVAGAAVAIAAVYVLTAIRASGTSDKELHLMDHKVGSAGSSSVIPQVRRRNSFGKL
jgi:hypothetical protein